MTTSSLIASCVAMIVFGLVGGASATSYYESYEGTQYIDQKSKAFKPNVHIWNTNKDTINETVKFKVKKKDRRFHNSFFSTKKEINLWEKGGWGSLTLGAFNIPGGQNFNNFNVKRGDRSAGITPVPEPSTILLIALGILGLLGYSRVRQGKKS